MSRKVKKPIFPNSYIGKNADEYNESRWMARNQKRTTLECIQYLYDSVIIVGGVRSSDANFCNNLFQTEKSWGDDILLVKLTSNGSKQYATPLGGRDYDGAIDVAIDSNNDIIILGQTRSDQFDFDSESSDITLQGLNDIVVIEISQSDSKIEYTKVFGGVRDEQ